MTNFSKALVVFNLFLAAGFLGAAFMARASSSDLDGRYKTLEAQRSELTKRRDELIGKERTPKGREFAKYGALAAKQKYETETKNNNQKLIDAQTEVKRLHDDLIKVQEENNKLAADNLREALAKLETVRADVAKQVAARDGRKKEIEDAKAAKAEMLNRKAQLDNDLAVLDGRLKEVDRRTEEYKELLKTRDARNARTAGREATGGGAAR